MVSGSLNWRLKGQCWSICLDMTIYETLHLAFQFFDLDYV